MENVASRFGQRLAHTEKKYRDQALKKLTLFLTKRTEWSDLEWDKLWKALFYCMWMSDKRPVQEELSTNLASLVHKVPTVEDALSFVDSFFRTMHREWHGIDGLRLDKFYSLIRKFVHQTLLLLQNHEWETALVERFVSILSSEIMSQLPNGLRLHVTDLFLTELHGAAADSVDTETFLLLLEPFYTLMSSEYDKTVFKRVRELVFLPLLGEYKFGPQKTKKKADDETDGEEDEEEIKVFEHVELPAVQHRIFAIASADDTAERNRTILYELYSQFFRVTKVDSLKANQEAAKNPTEKVEKKRKQPEPEAEGEAATGEEEPKKKSKKRRKNKKVQEGEDVAMDENKEEEPVPEPVTPEKKKAKKDSADAKTPVSTPVKAASEETPTKKQKKAAKEAVEEAAKAVESTPKSEKKAKKAAKEEVDAVVKDETPSKKAKKDAKESKVKEVPVAVEEATPSKKSKKEKKVAEAVVEESAPVKKEKKEPKKVEEKPAKDANVVVRSGMKFRRCASCGGLGKGVVPVGKDLCGHCQRTGAKPKAAPVKVKTEKAKAEKTPVVAEKAKPTKVKADTAVKSEEKPAKDANVVVRSGMKMRRCAGCGGVGKGLVPVGKDMCGHCQRTGQQKKKEQVATKKKRKAEELAAAVVEEDDSAPSKKVTFGKNRALPHELSVKRLKASAKETAVKELSSDIKGVLKAGTTPPKTSTKKDKKDKKEKTGGRMKAADFF